MMARADITIRNCVNGHAFTPENTYRRPDTGARQCRACRRRPQVSSSLSNDLTQANEAVTLLVNGT